MKIVFIMTASDMVLSFRRNLIQHILSRGHEVVVIAYDRERKTEIESLGVKFYCVEQNNRGLNPLLLLKYKGFVQKILKQERPDKVFTFQLKPNTLGVFAARGAGIKSVYSMVEGAGDVFANNGLSWKIIRIFACFLYRCAFNYSQGIIFLNNDDKAEFVRRGLVKENKAHVIKGIGVDLERFEKSELTNVKHFLMIARMLENKGVLQYCECAREVRKKYPSARFDYIGPEGNIKIEDINRYIEDGSICYLGKVNDVRSYLHDCGVFVLPSYYREGLPMSVMEAEATGRPIITCNSIGCRETVLDGYNGFLVDPKNVQVLAEKCIYMIEHSAEVKKMGANSRAFAEKYFDQKKINKIICEIIGM